MQANYLNLERWLVRIIKWGCLAVVFIPLIVAPDSYFPYIIQKAIIFRILVEFLFACYLVLAFLNPVYRPSKNIILWSVMAFFGIMLITTFTSHSVFKSWWGTWERMFGAFTYLHYFLWFIVLTGTFKKAKDWSLLLNAALLASLIVSLYSIGQRIGLGFAFQAGLERVNGTIGNAAFLASYLLFHIFIALLFFVRQADLKWKIFYAGIFLINLFVLILTGTRGAQIALFACLPTAVVFLLYFKMWRIKSVKIAIAAIALLLLSVGFMFIFKNSNLVQNNYWLKRMTNYSLNDNTTQTRFHSWAWGLKGFRDNLIFGLGPENYNIAFNRYFTADFYNYSGDEVWFDRSHNILVDTASTMGIFGLLAYLSLFVFAFLALLKVFKSNGITAAEFIILSLLLFAYFIQNLFVFDSHVSLIPFYLILAYISYLFFSIQINNMGLLGGNRFKINPFISLPISGVLFLILLFNINLRQIKENLYVYQAFLSGKSGRYSDAMVWYDKTLEVAINKIDLAILRSNTLVELAENNNGVVPVEQIMEDLNTTILWMDKAIELDSENMFLYYLQAKNYALGVQVSQDHGYLEKGLKVAERAQELSPENVRPTWILAQLYLYGGQAQKAIEYLERAKAMNDQLPETYFYLSIIYQNLKDEAKYYENLDQMIDKRFRFFTLDGVKRAIIYYDQKADLKRSIYLYQQLLKFEPKSLNYWTNYVDLLVADKQYDLALSTLLQISDIIPSFSSSAYTQYQEILKLKEINNQE